MNLFSLVKKHFVFHRWTMRFNLYICVLLWMFSHSTMKVLLLFQESNQLEMFFIPRTSQWSHQEQKVRIEILWILTTLILVVSFLWEHVLCLVSLSVTARIQPADDISSLDGIHVIHAIRFISEIHSMGGMIVFRAIDSVGSTNNKTCMDCVDSIDIIGSLCRISGTGAITSLIAMKCFGSIYDIHYIQVPQQIINHLLRIFFHSYSTFFLMFRSLDVDFKLFPLHWITLDWYYILYKTQI